MVDIVSLYKFKGLWVSTCSDNASNVITSTSQLINNPNFPLYASHPGCICHIINLVCEDFIEGFNYYLKENDDREWVETTDPNNEDTWDVSRSISIGKYDIKSILNDPFDGKATSLVRTITRFRTEIRKNVTKLEKKYMNATVIK